MLRFIVIICCCFTFIFILLFIYCILLLVNPSDCALVVVGHLAGIIVGLLYIKGPLGSIFDAAFRQRM